VQIGSAHTTGQDANPQLTDPRMGIRQLDLPKRPARDRPRPVDDPGFHQSATGRQRAASGNAATVMQVILLILPNASMSSAGIANHTAQLMVILAWADSGAMIGP